MPSWAKVGIATATGAVTAACGPAVGAVVSGVSNVLMDAVDGNINSLGDLAGSFTVGAATSLIGSGLGSIGKQAACASVVEELSEKSATKVKQIITNVLDVSNSERNAIKNLSYALEKYPKLPEMIFWGNQITINRFNYLWFC